jgi:hypothetical protein
MRERRTLVALGLTLLQLVLAATVTLETADVAWAPSYFDGDDGDARPLPLSERLPALAGSACGWTPLLAALAVVAVRRPTGGRRVAPARVRVRAPPLA